MHSMPTRDKIFLDLRLSAGRAHSEQGDGDLEHIAQFLHDNLSDEQLNTLIGGCWQHPKEILNGLNLAVKRISYKRNPTYDPSPAIRHIMGEDKLGGRPRIHG